MPPVVRLLAKRFGTSLIVLFGVSLLIFAIARVIPGDPARIALGPNSSAEQVTQLRERLHLNDNFFAQYGYFLSDLAHGDLGISLYTNRPVSQDIAEFLPATLELVFVSGLMMVLLGLPLGAAVARAVAPVVAPLQRPLELGDAVAQALQVLQRARGATAHVGAVGAQRLC